MSDIAASLFWILQELDINNEELFLPADTPNNSVNSTRLYNVLKKRHELEKQRLLTAQVQELADYQKRFSIEKKDDLFIQPNMVYIQEISASDFLQENAQAIADIFNIQRSDYNPCPRSASIDERIIKENDEILDRQKKFQDLLKDEYKEGINLLNKRHNEQIELLEKYHAKELSKTTSAKDKITVIKDNEINKLQKRQVGEDEHDSSSGKKTKIITNDSPRSNASKDRPCQQMPIPPSADKPNNAKIKPFSIQTASSSQSLSKKPSSGSIPALSQRLSERPFVHREPLKLAISVNKARNTKGKERAVQPVPVRTPTPISTPSNEPSSSSSSNSPLFNDRNRGITNPRYQKKLVSLIDEGSMVIRSKPNRVLIKGVNYGDPKYFDDAINGVYNPHNPITKRYMQGDYFLFHSSEESGIVMLGPVSKIQPLIQKFFLSI